MAQFSLGLDYLTGNGVPQSADTAALWLERAARGGHMDAMAHLATLALRGQYPVGPHTTIFGGQKSSPQYEVAFLWAQRAAFGGSTQGMIVLSALLSDGPESLRDRDAATALLETAVASGCIPAGLSLALMLARMPEPDTGRIAELLLMTAKADVPAAVYLRGVAEEFAFGCPQDSAAAVEFYRRAAKLGVRCAQMRLGCALLDGTGAPRDPVAGETWLRKAAAAGDARAACRLGDFYALGEGQPHFVESGAWFIRAAELGNVSAAQVVGFLHLTGTGLYEDRNEAARWFRLARQPVANVIIGDIASLLIGDEKEHCGDIDIRGWFKRQAAAGDAWAAYRLAVCFAIGLGGERDDGCAVAWLLKASSRIAAAQLLLGQMLLDGYGITRDEPAARTWIQQAANSGLIHARVALAELMANGRGGDPDPAAALRLFLEAAREGHLGALYAVGVIYGGGYGIQPDRALSQEWLRKAADGGHPAALGMLES